MPERLNLRLYILGFSFCFIVLAMFLMAALGVDREVLLTLAAGLIPVLMVLARGAVDSDESNEEKE